MKAADACHEIHQLLDSLPAYTAPDQVPFSDGLYFFYEDGEASEHGPTGRIVRVGNHARSDGGLVRRLRQHYLGRKNGSVFRKFLGGAILRHTSPGSPCLSPSLGNGHWERQDAKVCDRCQPIEAQVSSLLRSRFQFRCVAMPNRAERNRFEALLIATIAACERCTPSSGWLGLQAYAEAVRRTGLWNSQFTDGPAIEEEALRRFAELVKGSRAISESRRS